MSDYKNNKPENEPTPPQAAGYSGLPNKDAEGKNVESELVESRRQAEEYLNGWKRAKADYANFKKETEREREMLIYFAHQTLLKELLPVKDNFETAWKELKENERTGWVEGIGHIKRQLEEILKSAGLEKINEVGVSFDPERHEAVGKEKTVEGVASGAVLKVLRDGYALRGKVLRPAQVLVGE